jgi:hypothetical protein
MAKRIKCKDCGTEFSEKVKACPKCGVPAKKKTSLFAQLVAFLFVLAIAGVFLGAQGDPTSSGKTAKEEFTSFIKDNLNDPGSYAHIETRHNDKGDHILVITSFRAQNSSGAYSIETWQGMFDKEGKMLERPVQID